MESIFKRHFRNHTIIYLSLASFLIIFYFLAIFNIEYNKHTFFGKWYWLFFSIVMFATLTYIVYSLLKLRKNKLSFIADIFEKIHNHRFLLKQLVSRDFKTKYKRSILGIFWSFLNPLLMMGTQYLVFSTIFGNGNIKSYPTYLLVGVICWTFVCEATNFGLTSISSNANLINKVYVPKYIYTFSKVMSAVINFLLSLIPLFIITLCLRVWPTQYILLLFFDFFLLFIFLLGIALFLGSVMVFFRDIQFLWSVLTMAWMYATPIFYSVDQFKDKRIGTFIKFNPAYHYVNFARITLIGFSDNPIVAGACPTLRTIGICVLCSFASFLIGAFVFKKTQDKFVLYV